MPPLKSSVRIPIVLSYLQGSMPNDDLIPVFIPALVAILVKAERDKGSPLSEAEVLRIRDGAACVMLRKSMANDLTRTRGYEDLDPSLVWKEWQIARVQLCQEEERSPDQWNPIT